MNVQEFEADVAAMLLAPAWLNTILASATSDDRPLLFKTVKVEVFPHGLRFVSTDACQLHWCWLPFNDDDPHPEPSLRSKPDQVMVASDADGRMGSLCRYLLGLTKKVEIERVSLPLIDGEFPTWTGLVPKGEPSPLAVASFSTERLASFGKLCSVLNDYTHLRLYDNERPARYDFKGLVDLHGLLMPVRGES